MGNKILIVTTRPLEASLSSSIRKISTIKSLIEAGASITVLTTEIPNSSPNYNNNTSEINSIKKIELKNKKIYNSGVTKVRDKNNNIKKNIKRFARKVYFKFRVFDPLSGCIKYIDTLTGKLEPKYDIVISISDPKSSHLLAIQLLKNNLIECGKYIQIWGDPMYLDITNKSWIPAPFIKRIEKKLIIKADKIFYVSPLTLEEEMKLFPEYANKMDILYPTYQKETLYDPVSKIKKIGYFGDYNTLTRNILPLYNAIANTNYKLMIYGNSDLNLENKKNIKINRRVSFQEVKKIEKEVDLLVHLSNSSGTQIPSKIYQYMGTNKPILFILDGKKDLLLKVFKPYKRMLFCENNEKDIINTIKKFNNRESTIELTPIKEFSYKNLANKIFNE